jgi:hypothetical protein
MALGDIFSVGRSPRFVKENPMRSNSSVELGRQRPFPFVGDDRTQSAAAGARSSNRSSFRQRAAAIAVREWNDWKQGSIKETEPSIRARLQDYWRTGTGTERHEIGWPSKVPWSAAFISWVMRKAGAGRAFPYSGQHAIYISAARKNRLENNRNPFKAYRTSEVAPRIGDLVCKSRGGSQATYDTIQPGMKTHCDIVVEVRPNAIVTIGGNVSNSVSHTVVRTNPQGLIIAPSYFAVIRIGNE